MEFMKHIEDNQKEQKAVSDMISRARQLQTDPKEKEGCTDMPADMVMFFEEHHLAEKATGKDHHHNEKEWDFNIQSLQNYLDSISNKT